MFCLGIKMMDLLDKKCSLELSKPQLSIINHTVRFVQDELNDDTSGHDWWHIYRVVKIAQYLYFEEQKGDLFLILMSALLHDIADWKLNEDPNVGLKKIQYWLEKFELESDIMNSILKTIDEISFKGAKVSDLTTSIETQIVQDADRIDAIGAIGIARAFSYGAVKSQPMHNPSIQPIFHESFSQYQKSKTTTINHFYEKLLLLKDRMNTVTAQKIAIKRHHFLQEYLNQFLVEWEGSN